MKKLDAYLDFIGYDGLLAPSFETLYQLHLRHTRLIPFENLSPFTGMEVRLDIPSLLEKLTVQKRGGYCYEHNGLFQHVLAELGFETISLAARVRLNVPDDILTPRSHMLLLVKAQGQWFIADTGFGGMTLTVPIRFVMNSVQATPHGHYRLTRRSKTFYLEAKVKEEWKALYAFDLTPYLPPDYEVCNWYASRHPASHFVTNLVAARAAENGRHVLYDTQYSFYPVTGEPVKRCANSVREIKDLLENTFCIRASSVAGLDARLETLVAQGGKTGL